MLQRLYSGRYMQHPLHAIFLGEFGKRMLHCKINQTLQTLTTDVHRFGDVTTSITPCDITLVRRKNQLAQMMVAVQYF
jgi:hypothetical protein